MPEGRINATASPLGYEYFLKDHLGNTKQVFKVVYDAGLATYVPSITEENHYYPFGTRVPLTQSGLGNKYLYNSKELVDKNNLNWYHYGARWYDPALGRWTTMDPKDIENSPYNYAYNNPIIFIDPDGTDPDIQVFDENRYYQETIPQAGPDQIAIRNSKTGNLNIHDLNDPIHDSPILRDLIKNVGNTAPIVTMIGNNQFESMMDISGANSVMNKLFFNRYIYALKESPGRGKLDFTMYLRGYIDDKTFGMTSSDITGMFFLFAGSNTAYNPNDAGNYMWSAAMQRMGFSLEASLIDAHAFTAYDYYFNNHGTTPFDSWYDQKSIIKGHFH
jgi:RHS repeat-associated protein